MVLSFGIVAGASVAGVYNWASSIYTYNRDAWMTDLQLDQQRTFQDTNLQVNMKDMDREEIRDLMMSDIGKISNVILVTTLILSLAGEMLFEAQIPDNCAAYVLNAYMLCLGSAILHLVLTILFGMYAINEAYANSTRMLTSQIRPGWQAYFHTMQQRRKHEFTKAFDHRPMSQIFMPPLAARLKKAFSSGGPEAPNSSQGEQRDGTGGPGRDYAVGGQADKSQLELEHVLETQMPSGANDADGYRAAWRELGKAEWLHFKKYSFKCAAYGTKNLLEACGYLCIARLYGINRDAWALWAIQAIFISLNVIMMHFQYATRATLKSIVVAIGPLSCAVAATTSIELVDRVCVPLCFLSHVIGTIFAAINPIANEDNGASNHISEPVAQETTYFFKNGADCSCMDCGAAEPEQVQSTSPVLERRVSPAPAARSELDVDETAMLRQASNNSSAAPRKRIFAPTVAPQAMLQRGLIVLCVLWMSGFLWALYGSIWGMDFKNSMAMMPEWKEEPQIAELSPVPIVYPSPYFQPHAIVCPRGSFFLADKYRVFEILDSSRVVPFPCAVNGTISDLAATCDGEKCWPVVLLRGDPPTVLDCQTGEQRTLLQTTASFDHVSAQISGALNTVYAANEDTVVQYHWQEKRNGWAPFWDVARVEGGLKTMDVMDHLLLLFTGAGSLVVQNLETGERCGVWGMPPTLMGAGCGLQASESILVLVRNRQADMQDSLGRHAVSLMQARLPGAGDSCGWGKGDGSKAGGTLHWPSPIFHESTESRAKRSLRG